MSDLIDSTEMYLRTVLELEEEGIPALRARIAERLGISAPSVSEGVARLTNEGLLTLDDSRSVGLTPAGRERAEHVMRKHRLAERLLIDVLGLEPEHVHEEACRWEHVISDRVEAKLVEFLGHPERSPYGNPIPGAGVDDGELVPLGQADGTVTVVRISELLQQDHDAMAALADAQVAAGSRVEVESAPEGVTVIGAGGEAALSPDQAQLVYVATS
ncbi:MAG: metal-dependent transcriptional regulator [Nitriliruptorales bacterium]|nr:metal-dependent transcriptional regulator [Nitriliruptorales bacterium]